MQNDDTSVLRKSNGAEKLHHKRLSVEGFRPVQPAALCPAY